MHNFQLHAFSFQRVAHADAFSMVSIRVADIDVNGNEDSACHTNSSARLRSKALEQ